VNTLRGLLRELGLFIPEGIEKVLPQVRLLIADADSGIPDALRATVAAACDEIQSLGEQIDQARNSWRPSRCRPRWWHASARSRGSAS